MKKYLFLLNFFIFGSLHSVPPRQIPANLYTEFTMNGKIPVENWYLDGSKTAPVKYTKNEVEKYLEQIKQRKTFYYGNTDLWLYKAIEKYAIKDQKVVVFGSVKPVYESICLFYGGKPFTIEYNKWATDHPDLFCMTPDEYEKNPILFDCGLSISSFEHDGLGRYGDPINPWADIEVMQKVKKMIKPNGLLFLAVPIGKDCLVWNAHRIYGKIRLPLLLEGWQVIDFFGISGFNDSAFVVSGKSNLQPILVLKNIP